MTLTYPEPTGFKNDNESASSRASKSCLHSWQIRCMPQYNAEHTHVTNQSQFIHVTKHHTAHTQAILQRSPGRNNTSQKNTPWVKDFTNIVHSSYSTAKSPLRKAHDPYGYVLAGHTARLPLLAHSDENTSQRTNVTWQMGMHNPPVNRLTCTLPRAASHLALLTD